MRLEIDAVLRGFVEDELLPGLGIEPPAIWASLEAILADFTPRNGQTVEERGRQVFGVKVRLENREDRLRAGMSVDVVFPNVPR